MMLDDKLNQCQLLEFREWCSATNIGLLKLYGRVNEFSFEIHDFILEITNIKEKISNSKMEEF